MNKAKKISILIVLCLALAFQGCVSTDKTEHEKYIEGTYKALVSASTVYNLGMETAFTLRAGGDISEETFQKIMIAGVSFYDAYHSAVDALALYRQSLDTNDKAQVDIFITQVSTLAADILAIAKPYLED